MVDENVLSTDPKAILKQCPWFKSLSDSDLATLVESGARQKFEPFSHVVVEGETSSGLYVILRGAVGILKSGPNGTSYDIGEMREGALFGELSLLVQQPRSATVRTLSFCELLYISSEAFQDFLRGSESRRLSFYESCVQVLIGRLHELDEHYTSNQILLWRTATQKVKGEAA